MHLALLSLTWMPMPPPLLTQAPRAASFLHTLGRSPARFTLMCTSEECGPRVGGEAMRQRKWVKNAPWPLNVFAHQHLGEWRGKCTVYEVEAGSEGVPRLVEGATTECASGAVIGGGDAVVWTDELGGEEAMAAMCTNASVSSESFGELGGNMAVGNAFTLSSGPASAPLLLELGFKEGAECVRAKIVYDLDESGAAPQMTLRRVAIVREASGSAAGDAVAAMMTRTPGTGLYDTPSGDKEKLLQKYCSLYCDGGLTLVCPFALPLADSRGCISLDWTGAKMRYQADRKFGLLDGSLTTFEAREIQSDVARNYPPPGTGWAAQFLK
mmetsp:Transcript_24680/g.50069  ORF Transcript_24680/g.50069 Transcript_24680/m.50069 type:complete len:326 (+) Transcript_24680:27-1004(+)